MRNPSDTHIDDFLTSKLTTLAIVQKDQICIASGTRVAFQYVIDALEARLYKARYNIHWEMRK